MDINLEKGSIFLKKDILKIKKKVNTHIKDWIFFDKNIQFQFHHWFVDEFYIKLLTMIEINSAIIDAEKTLFCIKETLHNSDIDPKLAYKMAIKKIKSKEKNKIDQTKVEFDLQNCKYEIFLISPRMIDFKTHSTQMSWANFSILINDLKKMILKAEVSTLTDKKSFDLWNENIDKSIMKLKDFELKIQKELLFEFWCASGDKKKIKNLYKRILIELHEKELLLITRFNELSWELAVFNQSNFFIDINPNMFWMILFLNWFLSSSLY